MQILTNDRLRRAYDYYLDHPEDHRTNQWRYYEAQFTSRMAQSDVRVVVVGAIAIATLIQYLSRRALYLQVRQPSGTTAAVPHFLHPGRHTTANTQPYTPTMDMLRRTSIFLFFLAFLLPLPCLTSICSFACLIVGLLPCPAW